MNKFEKIYVLSLITNKEKQKFVKQQLDELDIDFEFIYGTDFQNWTNDANDNKIVFPEVYPNSPRNCYPNEFGCMLSHYNAVLYAYEFGFNNVLIIEDDICFIKNKELIKKCLENIPNDSDFITWDPRFWWENDKQRFIDELTNNKTLYTDYITNTNIFMYGGMMYALMNRKSMETYLYGQRHRLRASDNVEYIFLYSKLHRYICTKCICTDQYNIINNFKIEHIAYTNCYTLYDKNLTNKDFNYPNE